LGVPVVAGSAAAGAAVEHLRLLAVDAQHVLLERQRHRRQRLLRGLLGLHGGVVLALLLRRVRGGVDPGLVELLQVQGRIRAGRERDERDVR
jgi:hypothetical protein